jgi:propionyl-CoA synthetase
MEHTTRTRNYKLVRQQIGAVASLRHVAVVQRLPKHDPKILRKLMRSIVDESFQIPSTIDDEAIIDEITQTVKK